MPVKEILEFDNCEKVGYIDNTLIYKDDEGYFTRLHYMDTKENFYSIKERLGKNLKEVEASLRELNDWNYRAWHGEMQYILNETEKLKELIK